MLEPVASFQWRCVLAALALSAGPALAHKLNLFASADGRHIEGEVYFAGGGKAAGVPVSLTDAAGRVLTTVRSGDDGSFRFEAKAPVSHRVVAETPDGHRAEWHIGAAELAGAFPTTAAGAAPETDAPPSAGAGAGEDAVAAPVPAADHVAECTLDPTLIAAIEQAVARQVRPLREEAHAAREAAQFRDVLGGIGYIVGLAGLGLWWHCRQGRERR
jgi:nickel transport protein